MHILKPTKSSAVPEPDPVLRFFQLRSLSVFPEMCHPLKQPLKSFFISWHSGGMPRPVQAQCRFLAKADHTAGWLAAPHGPTDR